MIAPLEEAKAEIVSPVATIEAVFVVIAQGIFDAALVNANLPASPAGEIAAGFLAKQKIPFSFATGYDRIVHPEEFRDRPILSKPCSPEDTLVSESLPNLDACYARQAPSVRDAAAQDPALIEKGKMLAEVGRVSDEVPSCDLS